MFLKNSSYFPVIPYYKKLSRIIPDFPGAPGSLQVWLKWNFPEQEFWDLFFSIRSDEWVDSNQNFVKNHSLLHKNSFLCWSLLFCSSAALWSDLSDWQRFIIPSSSLLSALEFYILVSIRITFWRLVMYILSFFTSLQLEYLSYIFFQFNHVKRMFLLILF